MQTETIYKKKKGISCRELGEELMLYDEKQDKVHVLNETGFLIWELIDGKNTIESIRELFASHFGNVPPEELQKDIDEMIERLESESLITRTTSTG